jgi:hypothetical protein
MVVYLILWYSARGRGYLWCRILRIRVTLFEVFNKHGNGRHRSGRPVLEVQVEACVLTPKV